MFCRAKCQAASIFIAALAFSNAALADTADRIWSGGPVITMNDAAMRAEAVAEKDGRIIAVGSKDDVLKLKGDSTKLIDLGGRAMIPGFVDAHRARLHGRRSGAVGEHAGAARWQRH